MHAILILGFALGATTSPSDKATLELALADGTDTYLIPAHCEEDTLTETAAFSVSNLDGLPVVNSTDKLYVWWESGDDCTSPSDNEADQLVYGIALDSDSISQTSGTPLTTSTVGLDFPDDVSNATLTYQEIFARLETDPCETEMNHVTLKLCFAVDLASSTAGDAVTISDTAEGWTELNLVIDTEPPPAPTIDSVRSLDGSIDIAVSVSDSDARVANWKLYLQPSTGDSTEETDCTAWTVTPTDFAASEGGSDTLNTRADNGIIYDICVVAEDEAGNLGNASAIVEGEARNECDFIECYPGDLKDGYCTAAPASLWWFAALGILIRRRFRGAKR